jgi:predicted Holliday junction resolvase-like endonuclease
MKLVICKTNLKISILIILILSIEILTFSEKNSEMQNLLKVIHKYNLFNFLIYKRSNKFISEKSKTKFESTSIGEKIRFKSKINGESDESNDILVNAVVTDTKKE